MEKRKLDTYHVFLKFFRNEASEEESNELLHWLEEDKTHLEEYFQAKRIWSEGIATEESRERTDHSWERLQFRLFGSEDQKKKVPIRKVTDWRIYALAASVAVLLMFSVFTTLRVDRLKSYSQRINQIEVPFGSRSNITLPDGTIVWLNSGSKLSYAQAYFSAERKVTLDGEAYFDVAKHLGTTFTVRTNDLDIKALGTRFNVKAYPDEHVVETYVEEGKVVIDNGGANDQFKPVILRPRQKLTYVKEEAAPKIEQTTVKSKAQTTAKEKTDIEKPEEQIRITLVRYPETDLSWKDEKLVIRSETISSMSRKLERFYNIEIIFADAEVENFTFSGTLDEVTIDEVLKAISSTAPISYVIDKKRVTLRTAR